MQRGKQNSFQSTISKRDFDIQNFESCKGLARNVDRKECVSVEILYFEKEKVIDMKRAERRSQIIKEIIKLQSEKTNVFVRVAKESDLIELSDGDLMMVYNISKNVL